MVNWDEQFERYCQRVRECKIKLSIIKRLREDGKTWEVLDEMQELEMRRKKQFQRLANRVVKEKFHF